MRRAAAIVVTAVTMGTVFLATPAQAEPMSNDPARVCDTVCRRGIIC